MTVDSLVIHVDDVAMPEQFRLEGKILGTEVVY